MNHRWENNICIKCGIKRTKKTFKYLMAITNHPPYDHYIYEQGYIYEDGESTWVTYKSCTTKNINQ